MSILVKQKIVFDLNLRRLNIRINEGIKFDQW